MKQIAKKINQLYMKNIDPVKLQMCQNLQIGNKICIKYKIQGNLFKLFEGILIEKRRVNDISCIIHILNYSLDERVKQSFFIYNPNVSIVNVVKYASLRQSNASFLMHSNNIRRILNRNK